MPCWAVGAIDCWLALPRSVTLFLRERWKAPAIVFTLPQFFCVCMPAVVLLFPSRLSSNNYPIGLVSQSGGTVGWLGTLSTSKSEVHAAVLSGQWPLITHPATRTRCCFRWPKHKTSQTPSPYMALNQAWTVWCFYVHPGACRELKGFWIGPNLNIASCQANRSLYTLKCGRHKNDTLFYTRYYIYVYPPSQDSQVCACAISLGIMMLQGYGTMFL